VARDMDITDHDFGPGTQTKCAALSMARLSAFCLSATQSDTGPKVGARGFDRPKYRYD
jgi:hypothetical protein